MRPLLLACDRGGSGFLESRIGLIGLWIAVVAICVDMCQSGVSKVGDCGHLVGQPDVSRGTSDACVTCDTGQGAVTGADGQSALIWPPTVGREWTSDITSCDM